MRCSIPEIKKFTSTLVQGMTKGNHELVMLLKEQSKEAWETRKFNVKSKENMQKEAFNTNKFNVFRDFSYDNYTNIFKPGDLSNSLNIYN